MMMKSTRIAIAVTACGVVAAIVVFFVLGKPHPTMSTRLRGFVDHGSIERRGNETRFVISDGPMHTTVVYEGPLPDTFREGAQVMVVGHAADRQFVAQQVSAKCPDTYNTKDGPKPAASFR
jgi:cytochrome c-type biogenesis protein CcmE